MTKLGSLPAEIRLGGEILRADLARGHDLSIPLRFGGSQPRFFAAPSANATPFEVGSFNGSVRRGASCNCSTYTLTPHCNGTHTECVGHITNELVSIRDVAARTLLLARLVTVTPVTANISADPQGVHCASEDRVIDRASLEKSGSARRGSALIVRTLPNTGKLAMNYDAATPPYFTAAAMQWIVAEGIDHLVVDLPSVDRARDGGVLAAHRIFWGMPLGATAAGSATRAFATITELAFIDDSIQDGNYLLDLQVAPFESDAAPSRPLVYPVTIAPSE